MEDISKILLIQFGSMNRLLMTTAAVKQMRGLFPDAQIELICDQVEFNPYCHGSLVDRLWELGPLENMVTKFKFYLKVFQQKYDLVIDFSSNERSATITKASQAPIRMGYRNKGYDVSYTDLAIPPTRGEYHAISNIRLIEVFGGNSSQHQLEFPVDEEAELFAKQFILDNNLWGGAVAVSLSPRQRNYVSWKAENFAGLADHIVSRGKKVILIYDEGQKSFAREVHSLVKNKAEIVYDYPQLDLWQLKAVLGHCSTYLGNDGIVKLLAVSAKIMTLTLFGTTGDESLTPPDSKLHSIIFNRIECRNKCRGCKNRRCLKTISLEDVIREIEKHLFFQAA